MHNKGRQQAGPPSEFKLPYFFGSNPTSLAVSPLLPSPRPVEPGAYCRPPGNHTFFPYSCSSLVLPTLPLPISEPSPRLPFIFLLPLA